jgi:hypothetical protein
VIEYELHPQTKLSELTVDLSFELPDLAEDAAVHLLRRAAIQMCRSGDLMRRQARIRIQPGVENYLLEPVDEVDLVAILSVGKRDDCFQPRLGGRLTGKPMGLSGGAGCWFTPPNEIHFINSFPPDVYQVNFSVAPLREACRVDQDFAGRYYELLLVGARALAYDLGDKPWSNAARAGQFRAQFEMGIRAAKAESLMGRQRGRLRSQWGRVL